MPATLSPSAPVGRDEVVSRLADGSAVIVDVLPRESFAEGHIPGALSLPLAEIPARAREVLPDPSRDIIVYCGKLT